MKLCPKGHTIATIGGIDYCPPCELAERELERQAMTKDRRIETAKECKICPMCHQEIKSENN